MHPEHLLTTEVLYQLRPSISDRNFLKMSLVLLFTVNCRSVRDIQGTYGITDLYGANVCSF